MRIPILDLSDDIREHGAEYAAAAKAVIESTQFILGPNVHAFESEIAAYLGCKHAVGCNSGTDALVIGLRALGVGPGDEVIVPSFTFFATAEAVSLVGGTPVFADIDPTTYCMGTEQAQKCFSPKTKAVVPVHLFGHAAPMTSVCEWAAERRIAILEDAAQSMGASVGDRKLGTWGKCGAFSFFPSKNLGAFGDGGLMTSDDDALAQSMRRLRVHGSHKRYHNEEVGYCSRLDEMQAAFLRIKLRHLDASNQGRRDAAVRYREMLASVPQVGLPAEQPGTTHVYHQFTIRVPAERRDDVHRQLADTGIATMIYYPIPVHLSGAYRNRPHLALPEPERASKEVLSLPIWPTISASTQWEVVQAIRAALA